MASGSSPDYKALFLQEKVRTQPTTSQEFIRHCHNLLSRPLRAAIATCSTTGTIPPPTGKCCLTQLLPWADCETKQQETYNSVCSHLQPVGIHAPRLFVNLNALEDHGKRCARRPISSEQDLQTYYERVVMEDLVYDIIRELCNIPDAQEELQLGNGVWFENHANALDENARLQASHPSSSH